MSSGIKKDKKSLDYEEHLDKIIEPINLSKACVSFSSFFEESDPEKKCIEIKGIPFSKYDPIFQIIMKKEFLK